MKRFLLAVFFIGFQARGDELSQMAETNIRTCGIVSSEYNLKEGKLSDYWAQELIGSDLLREEIREIGPPPHTNLISVFDSPVNGHNHNVRHLISGLGNYAVLPELGEQISLFNVGNLRGEEYHLSVSQIKEDEEIPSFINHSMSWSKAMSWSKEGEGARVYKSFKSLSPSTLVVTSSGNSFPQILDIFKSKASLDFNVIIVGSFSPLGFVSNFSQEGEEVLILAPSDNYVTSANFDGEYKKFGGTSGAASLVTGALAGFEWISAYHPTGEEAKILLSKTAIPTLHSHERPQLNGKGLLNAYKLGRVAKRLKDKCQTDKDCFQQEIKNEENYLFPSSFLNDDEELGIALSQTFPSCSFLEKDPTDKPYYPSCDEKAQVFNRLREEVLLSPERKEPWELLSCIYREAGFSSNALMLDRTALALTPKESFDHEFLSQIFPIFKEFHREEYYRLSFLIARALFNEGREDEIFALIQSLNNESRSLFFFVSSIFRGGLRSDLLDKLVKDPDSNIRETVAEAAGYIGGERGLNLLEQLIKDPDYWIRRAVAYSAGRIGGKGGLSLLDQLVKDPHFFVRRIAIDEIERISRM